MRLSSRLAAYAVCIEDGRELHARVASQDDASYWTLSRSSLPCGTGNATGSETPVRASLPLVATIASKATSPSMSPSAGDAGNRTSQMLRVA